MRDSIWASGFQILASLVYVADLILSRSCEANAQALTAQLGPRRRAILHVAQHDAIALPHASVFEIFGRRAIRLQSNPRRRVLWACPRSFSGGSACPRSLWGVAASSVAGVLGGGSTARL